MSRIMSVEQATTTAKNYLKKKYRIALPRKGVYDGRLLTWTITCEIDALDPSKQEIVVVDARTGEEEE